MAFRIQIDRRTDPAKLATNREAITWVEGDCSGKLVRRPLRPRRSRKGARWGLSRTAASDVHAGDHAPRNETKQREPGLRQPITPATSAAPIRNIRLATE